MDCFSGIIYEEIIVLKIIGWIFENNIPGLKYVFQLFGLSKLFVHSFYPV